MVREQDQEQKLKKKTHFKSPLKHPRFKLIQSKWRIEENRRFILRSAQILDYVDIPHKDEKDVIPVDPSEASKKSEELTLNVQHGNETAHYKDLENEYFDPMADDPINDDMEKDEAIDRSSDFPENVESDNFDPMADDLIDEENKTDEGIDRSADITEDSSETIKVEKQERRSRDVSKMLNYKESSEDSDEDDEPSTDSDSSEIIQVEKEGRPSRKVSKPLKYDESSDDSEGEDEPIMKKKRSESVKKNGEETPKCVLCEIYPSTPYGYVWHLSSHHKSTLIASGIYLKCTCSLVVSSQKSLLKHRNECDGKQFTLHKVKSITTPKCVICETYPTTVRGYIDHLKKHHKSTLIKSGIYLRCACGYEGRSQVKSLTAHHKECDGRQFTLHKLNKKETPKCILCEKYPSTPYGYERHLSKRHKSTLIANGVYLKCSCGYEIRFRNKAFSVHNKECDRREFTVHKIDED